MTNYPTVGTTIIAVFCFQILILCVLLLLKKEHKVRNRLLALVLFFAMLKAANFSLSYVLYLSGWDELYRYFNLKLLFGIGPAIYFYTYSLLRPAFVWQRKYLIHFMPVGLEFLYHRSYWFEEGVIGILQVPSNTYEYLYVGIQYLGLASQCIYALLALGLAWRYYRKIDFRLSEPERKQVRRLISSVAFLISFFGLWYLMRGADVFLFRGAYRMYYYFPMFTLLSAQMVWLGFKAYHWKPLRDSEVIKVELGHSIAEVTKEPDAYDAIMQQLEHLLQEQRLFLDPELSLKSFSQSANLPQRTVSKAINAGTGHNFQTFINRYRIEEFQGRVRQPDAVQLTLLAHAFASGFASKSTFNAVFKKYTGLTPRQYVKQLEEKGSAKGPKT
ncbi:MAG: AraC family transcriptional regulator [Saprospiraceae bacterium]|nr:AraC family transcriptional regulator [Saprospiraceae bacterium]